MRAALRAEWIKLRTVRSAVLVPAIAILLGLGVSLLDVASIDWKTVDRSSFDPVAESFSGFQFTELAFGALGVLVITSEYGTGLIGTTFLAFPRRGRVLAAKILVLAAFTAAVCLVSSFGAFVLCQAVLSGHDAGVGLGSPHAARAVLSAAGYLVAVTLVGFGIGGFLRHTAGAMAAMVGVVFLSWPAARAVESISTLPSRMQLANAAEALTTTLPITGPHADRIPSPALATLTLLLHPLFFLTLAAWRFLR